MTTTPQFRTKEGKVLSMESSFLPVGLDEERTARMRTALPDARIAEVATGDEALDRAKTRPALALVVDFPVPLGDGRALTAVLKADPDTASIPVVASSG